MYLFQLKTEIQTITNELFLFKGTGNSNQLYQSHDGSAGGEDRWWGRGKSSWDTWSLFFSITLSKQQLCFLESLASYACSWDLFTLAWLACLIFVSACGPIAFCQIYKCILLCHLQQCFLNLKRLPNLHRQTFKQISGSSMLVNP